MEGGKPDHRHTAGQAGISMQIYLNGQYCTREEAKVSVFDHGFLYGDGVFEGYVHITAAFLKWRSICKGFMNLLPLLLDIPLSVEEMAEATLETVRRNNLQDAYIRTVVSRGPGDLGLIPKCYGSTVVIIADKISLYAQILHDHRISVTTAVTRQRNANTLNRALNH